MVESSIAISIVCIELFRKGEWRGSFVNNVWLCLLVSLLFILTKRYDMDIGHKQVKDNRGMRVDQQVERDKDRER